MNRKGDCWDHTVPERFLATLAHALLARTVRHSHHDANVAQTDFIEHWRHSDRQHSTLGFLRPQRYKDQLRQMTRAA
jgi:putative transposase